MIKENGNLLFFENKKDIESGEEKHGKWKLMIVDDEEEVHQITKIVLNDFTFENKSLDFISAHSLKEAKVLMKKHPDTAVILLDVVMEEEDSGLKFVKYVREELKNNLARIILRTGQPGQAPEKKIIVDYDINDYKEKTELTAQRLFTTLVAALRSYRDITIIHDNKEGLEKIIKSSASIFKLQSMRKFATGVLTQLTSIFHINKGVFSNQSSSFAATKSEGEYFILAGTGDFYKFINRNIKEAVQPAIYEEMMKLGKSKKSIYFDNHYVLYFQCETGSENIVYIDALNNLSELDQYLIEIFCTNVSIAFDNIYLNKEIENTQKEIIFTLGEIAEARSKETGNHVKRVAEFSKLLALKYGLPEEEAEMIRLAAPMHDIGKLAIPDSILNKPGKLTVEEFEVMKSHSALGYEMLKRSSRTIMKTAAIISLQHHEKFNSKGYPCGLRGNDIHIYGRITAVADVFDALGTERVYKKAWKLEDILQYFKNERGEHFDPDLVDLFFDNLDKVLSIRDAFPDV
ncbi:MAG: DUF3369 domain-containing protein [Clostridia bacterium]|nr:DUF3369 domain-containing protein [Clostridia bacterium]